jgi:hypothetical protein
VTTTTKSHAATLAAVKATTQAAIDVLEGNIRLLRKLPYPSAMRAADRFLTARIAAEDGLHKLATAEAEAREAAEGA